MVEKKVDSPENEHYGVSEQEGSESSKEQEGGWKKVERSEWDWTENKVLVGVLRERVEGLFGGHNYVFATEEGEVLVYGKTALESKLRGVEAGTECKVVYLGVRKSERTGRTYDDFEAYTK